MEKKIERVPYISKWYKEEQNDEFKMLEIGGLINQAIRKLEFYENYRTQEPIIVENKINESIKILQKALDKTGIIVKSAGPLSDEATKKLQDELLKFDFGEQKQNTGSDFNVDKIFNYTTTTICEHCRTSVDNRPQHCANQKSYGTLCEHWKELMTLFEFKNNEGLNSLNDFVKSYEICKKRNIEFRVLCIPDDDSKISLNKQEYDAHKLYYIYETLGIDFIKDFVKACEKCEG